jgi:hypothetical protein
MLAQRGNLVETSLKSLRVLLLIGSLGSYFVFAFYTALLTAETTNGPSPLSIESFEDVLTLEYQGHNTKRLINTGCP